MADKTVNRFGTAKGLIMSDVSQTDIDLSGGAITWVTTNNTFDFRDFKAATRINLPSPPSCMKGVEASGLPLLTNLYILGVSGYKTFIRFRDCVAMTNFGNITSSYWSSIDASGCTSLTTLSAVIRWEAGKPPPLTLTGCNALTTLDFYCGLGASTFDAITLDFSGLPVLRYIQLRIATGFIGFIAPPCSSNAYFNLSQCPNLITADLSLATDLTNVTFQQCSALTTITINPAITVISLNAGLCALTENCVNDILAKCVASGLSGQTLDIGGGSNHAPTGQGLVDKAHLINNHGWSVSTS